MQTNLEDLQRRAQKETELRDLGLTGCLFGAYTKLPEHVLRMPSEDLRRKHEGVPYAK